MTDTQIETLRRQIGERGRKRRESLGLLITDVASRLGSTYQSVYGMEQRAPSTLRVLVEWAAALECRPSWLIFGRGKKTR